MFDPHLLIITKTNTTTTKQIHLVSIKDPYLFAVIKMCLGGITLGYCEKLWEWERKRERVCVIFRHLKFLSPIMDQDRMPIYDILQVTLGLLVSWKCAYLLTTLRYTHKLTHSEIVLVCMFAELVPWFNESFRSWPSWLSEFIDSHSKYG